MKVPALLLLATHVVISRAMPVSVDNSARRSISTVYQFPQQHWLENLAARSDGTLLATDVAQSQIYLIDPRNPGIVPQTVARFPANTSLTGIAEIEPDVFYTQAAKGNVYRFQFEPNSSVVYRVDMREYKNTGEAVVSEVVRIPSAIAPNGMTLLDRHHGTLLIADSPQGVVYRLNVYTKEYEIVFDDPLLKPVPGSRPEFGVNGVHVVERELYFSNLNQGLLCKVPIDLSTGKATGAIKVISNQLPGADDFAVDPRDHSVWLTRNVPNTLSRVLPCGKVETVAGGNGSAELVGPVAAVFGRTEEDKRTLYVSTDGLTVNGTGSIVTSNGKVVKLDT